MTHHTEIYANPNSSQTQYLFIHGCYNEDSFSTLMIFKLTQESDDTKCEMIQDQLILNDSSPDTSWHTQTTLTEKGVLFFKIQTQEYLEGGEEEIEETEEEEYDDYDEDDDEEQESESY